MSNRESINDLIRFFTQEAKLPIARSLPLIKKLQARDITTVAELVGADVKDLTAAFDDDAKLAKTVWLAGKRSAKKKKQGQSHSAKKQASRESELSGSLESPGAPSAPRVFQLNPKTDLSLPEATRDEEAIAAATSISCNRAPVLLAFVFKLLQYTNPGQPVASRLSLAGAMIARVSKAKAVNIGLEQDTKEVNAEGLGQVSIMGTEVRTIRRVVKEGEDIQVPEMGNEAVDPVWGVDLEAWKKSGTSQSRSLDMPIHTPQNARSYLLKSFPDEKLALLFGALELLFEFWMEKTGLQSLDSKAWRWYVEVRPSIPSGIQGWGAKGELKLGDILKLRQT